MTAPRIWVLLGPRTGDNNQALALAEALGLPFETRTLAYNPLQALSVWLPGTAATLDRESRLHLQPPWPDLVVAIGRRSVPIARWIRKQNGGRTKLIRIGHPRIRPGLFDLVITTRQYPVPPGDNVLLLPLAMSRYSAPPEPTDEEAAFLDQMGSFRLFAVGGPTKYWGMPDKLLIDAIAKAEFLTNRTPFSVVVATSRRTPLKLVEHIRAIVRKAPNMAVVDGPSPRFGVLLNAAAQIFVTGDSVSMISEAVLTGRPVAIIPIEQDEKGQRRLGAEPQEHGPDARRRDLRRFWTHLIEEGMAGTLETGPIATSSVPNPNVVAAEAVYKLLGDLG